MVAKLLSGNVDERAIVEGVLEFVAAVVGVGSCGRAFSSRGSGTQLASMPRKVFLVMKGASKFLKKWARVMGAKEVAGAYAETSLLLRPSMRVLIETRRPSALVARVERTRAISSPAFSLSRRSMAL